MIDLLRDQVSAQLENSGTNDLESVAALAAGLAVVLALVIVRATVHGDPGWSWWWYPLPAFAVPTVLVGIPLVPARKDRKFQQGTPVAKRLRELANEPQPFETVLVGILQDLHTSWAHNDKLLERESRCFIWGLGSLAVVTTLTIGMYIWALY